MARVTYFGVWHSQMLLLLVLLIVAFPFAILWGLWVLYKKLATEREKEKARQSVIQAQYQRDKQEQQRLLEIKKNQEKHQKAQIATKTENEKKRIRDTIIRIDNDIFRLNRSIDKMVKSGHPCDIHEIERRKLQVIEYQHQVTTLKNMLNNI